MRTGQMIQKIYSAEISRIQQELMDVIPSVLLEVEILSMLAKAAQSHLFYSSETTEGVMLFTTHNEIHLMCTYANHPNWGKGFSFGRVSVDKFQSTEYLEGLNKLNIKLLRKIHPHQFPQLIREWAKKALL
jgi:hypothetical protein